jgi:DNA invertase Pin-like site-specific DNA recombinase
MRKHKTNFISLTEKLDLNTSLGNVVFVIISAISQLERDLIAERVRNGLAAAKARGKRIGRERKRNDVLIHSLLDAGMSFRAIAKIAKCSHGSVSASKLEYVAKKAKEQADRAALAFDGPGPVVLPATATVVNAVEPSDPTRS